MGSRPQRSLFDRTAPSARRSAPRLEVLEDRTLLSGWTAPDLSTTGLLVTSSSGAMQKVMLSEGQSLSEALLRWQSMPGVASVEVDHQVQVSIVPTAPLFGQQYGLLNTGQNGGLAGADINARTAWSVTTGSMRTTVAVIDTGIDYQHPDLYRNIWINQGEIPASRRTQLVDVDNDGRITFRDLNNPINQGIGKISDLNGNGYIDAGDLLRPMIRDASGLDTGEGGWETGIDQDGNGYIDDLVGWNFVSNTNNPFDDNGHGTHVAGIIGADGLGNGVAGVTWNVQLAALKFLGANGSGLISNAIAALNYAVRNGIPISNNSWGGGSYSPAMNLALNRAAQAGHLFVAAAGNSGQLTDSRPSYPASYPHANIVAVAASDNRDRLASFSNYGARTVDVAAPGVNVLSTLPGGRHGYYSGTSMAAPFVAGAAALLWSQYPSLRVEQLIARLLCNVDRPANLLGKVATGGRLNVGKAMMSCQQQAQNPYVLDLQANHLSVVSSVRVRFSEPILPASFTTAAVSLVGPAGRIAVQAVRVVPGSGNTCFDVCFAPQGRVGAYTLTLNNRIRSSAGLPLAADQSGSQTPYKGIFHVFQVATTQISNTVAQPIWDFETTTSTIVVSRDVPIADLDINFTIYHSYTADLRISLTGPDGTTVLLVNCRGNWGQNFLNTWLDDEAAVDISRAAAPFRGVFRPEEALSAFLGKSLQGTWTLSVYDNFAWDTGRLVNWSLRAKSIVTPLVNARQVASPTADAYRPASEPTCVSGWLGNPPTVVVNQFANEPLSLSEGRGHSQIVDADRFAGKRTLEFWVTGRRQHRSQLPFRLGSRPPANGYGPETAQHQGSESDVDHRKDPQRQGRMDQIVQELADRTALVG
jgi:serine protease